MLTSVLIPMVLSGGFGLLGYWMGFRAGSSERKREEAS